MNVRYPLCVYFYTKLSRVFLRFEGYFAQPRSAPRDRETGAHANHCRGRGPIRLGLSEPSAFVHAAHARVLESEKQHAKRLLNSSTSRMGSEIQFFQCYLVTDQKRGSLD